MEQQTKTIQPVSDFEYLRPPKEAYLHFPREERLVRGKEKKTIRLYFDGDVPYTEFEIQRLDKFKQYLKEKNATNLIDNWSDSEIQRQLHGNYYDNKKTMQDIQANNEWKEELKNQTFDEDIKTFLEKEYIYVSGRDEKYRPIIVFNVYKLNPKEFPYEKLVKGVDFYYNKILDYMFVPGQIENWTMIMDCGNQGLGEINTSMIKKIIASSNKHYKSRLHRLYIVQASSAITAVWKVAKFFLDSQTVEKITIQKEAPIPKLFLHANKSQVPVLYGGTQTKTQSWPIAPQGEEGPFNVEGVQQTEDFITPAEYRSKVIKDGHVCKAWLKE